MLWGGRRGARFLTLRAGVHHVMIHEARRTRATLLAALEVHRGCTDSEVVEQVRRTVIHEVGHHFASSSRRLDVEVLMNTDFR